MSSKSAKPDDDARGVNNVSNVNDLFAEAHAEGVLSPSSLQALTGVDLGAKTQELTRNGVAARSVTLIITDGADQHSCRAKARDVAALVRDMTRTEAHIVAAMGISDGCTDFRAVFRDMGIEDRWILTPGNDAREIRKAFQVFSQSAVRASQAASFSPGALSGFTN